MASLDNVEEINLKLCILGEGEVGKTSIVSSFLNKEFLDVYMPTIGSNIEKKEYEIGAIDFFVRINMWDIGGQRSFNPLNPAFFNNVDAALLVFDLSKPKETLKDIESVYLKQLRERSEDCIILCVGNKLDLITTIDELKEFENLFVENDIPLVLTSALTKENLDEMFELIIYTFLSNLRVKYTDKKYHGLSNIFLKLIDKTESELRKILVSFDELHSFTIKNKPTKVVKRKVKIERDIKEIRAENYQILQAQLRKFDFIKKKINDLYDWNLGEINDLIISLKNTPIDSLVKSIDNFSRKIKVLKDKFQSDLDSLLKSEMSTLKLQGMISK